jgi:hypothetical protein
VSGRLAEVAADDELATLKSVRGVTPDGNRIVALDIQPGEESQSQHPEWSTAIWARSRLKVATIPS